ncbi:MAG: hypothetical protein R3C44_19645 [Chloroflexota bacterium]
MCWPQFWPPTFLCPALPVERTMTAEGDPLTSLTLGESAEVVALSPGLRGAERRRLLDLVCCPAQK